MNNMFLGKPATNIEFWMKTHGPTFDGDIFTKYDGTVVKTKYDPTKTAVNIDEVDDYENVRHFNFGKSYTLIDDLYYSNNVHGIDLSRTSINEVGLDDLYLDNNQLSSFSLPASLTGFDILVLNNKLYGSNESFILDMTYVEDATKIPICSNKIYGEDFVTYSGTILVKADLLTAFKTIWGNEYNYQGV